VPSLARKEVARSTISDLWAYGRLLGGYPHDLIAIAPQNPGRSSGLLLEYPKARDIV
jgi:hypothetical protein